MRLKKTFAAGLGKGFLLTPRREAFSGHDILRSLVSGNVDKSGCVLGPTALVCFPAEDGANSRDGRVESWKELCPEGISFLGHLWRPR